MLNFHGLGGNGAGQAEYSEYEKLAESEGFAVVHPSGLVVRELGGIRNWEETDGSSPARNDVQFASDLIDRIATQTCIDQSRVYATGFSNGGFFSAYLVCELADRIAAAVSVGGISHPDDCEPSRPVAIAAIHGTTDDIVPFDGSGESLLLGDGTKSKGISADKESLLDDFFTQVMPDELAEFAPTSTAPASPRPRLGSRRLSPATPNAMAESRCASTQSKAADTLGRAHRGGSPGFTSPQTSAPPLTAGRS